MRQKITQPDINTKYNISQFLLGAIVAALNLCVINVGTPHLLLTDLGQYDKEYYRKIRLDF